MSTRWWNHGRVGVARQGGREPQQPAAGVGDDLHVHAVAPVFVGVVGRAVAARVALGEGAVQQDEVGIALAQRLQQTRCMFGEQVDDRAWVATSNTSLNGTCASCVAQGLTDTKSLRQSAPTRT